MRWTSIFISVTFVAVLLGFGATIHDRFAYPRLNVILLTVESLRAERFSPELAPNFFKAAQQASTFQQHRSIASWTAPNIIALLTGLSPFEQGVHARGQTISHRWEIPLGTLTDHGMEIGSVQAFAKSENFENLGMRVVNGETVEGWIARRTLRKEPFFFWHHYLGTHLPYNPSDAYLSPNFLMPKANSAALDRIEALRRLPAIRAGTVNFESQDKPHIDALYDGGIREFDAWFDSFWQFFQEAGLRENTLLIVTADHGEELLERGNVGHASTTRAGTLFEESVRIPLFVWWPQPLGIKPNAKISRPTDHLDIMPTIFDVLGLSPKSPFSGNSLSGASADRDWYALTSRGGFSEEDPNKIRRFIAAVVVDRWKLIVDTDIRKVVRTRLYDLEEDPAEQKDLSRARRDIIQKLLPRLLSRLDTFVLPSGGTGETQTNPMASNDGSAPRWVFPAQSKAVSWDSLKGRALLEWSGNPSSSYILEYTAGSGALAVSGQIVVSGTKKDFGEFSRQYWNTWIVPYEVVTLRVRTESNAAWSPTLTLSLTE